jgi:hypothetical protein
LQDEDTYRRVLISVKDYEEVSESGRDSLIRFIRRHGAPLNIIRKLLAIESERVRAHSYPTPDVIIANLIPLSILGDHFAPFMEVYPLYRESV